MQRRDKNTMKLLISLLLCSLLIGYSTSHATEIIQKPIPIQDQDQETQQDNVRPYGQAYMMVKKIICNDSEVLIDLLKSEPGPQVPIFFGQIKNPQGDTIGVTQIFIEKALTLMPEKTSGLIICKPV